MYWDDELESFVLKQEKMMNKGLMVFHTITTAVFGYANYILFTEFAGEPWVHWGHYVFWVGVLVLSIGGLVAAILNKTGEKDDVF